MAAATRRLGPSTPEQLRSTFLFEALDDDQVAWLVEHGQVLGVEEGTLLFSEGEPAATFFVMLDGQISMTRRVTGGEIELVRTDHPGSYFGATQSYVAREHLPQVYVNSVRVTRDARLFALSAEEFGAELARWFPMAMHLLEDCSSACATPRPWSASGSGWWPLASSRPASPTS